MGRQTKHPLEVALLLQNMKSEDLDTALRALAKLHELGGLQDGSLRGVDLARANLPMGDLSRAVLPKATLTQSNLREALLLEADLQGADLSGSVLQAAFMSRVNLNGAKLTGVDLEEANLSGANLGGADLSGANLVGADLSNANLEGADLTDARINEATRLPDKVNWAPYSDMARFTDAQHPGFWRSIDPESPAYRPEVVSVSADAYQESLATIGILSRRSKSAEEPVKVDPDSLLGRLHARIAYWENLAATARQRAKNPPDERPAAYWSGISFAYEAAAAELRALLEEGG
jgi:hypothetical protein